MNAHDELLRIHQLVCPEVTHEVPDGRESVTIEAVKSLAYRVHMADELVADLRTQLAAEQALRKVKDDALEAIAGTVPENKYEEMVRDTAAKALSQTSHTAELDAKIAEAEIKVLEELRDKSGAWHETAANLQRMIEQRKEQMK
jgi:hypothetical protein